ncbi:RNA-directed DNA polymerase, eukaryota [Tanacetum coccineum]
MRTKFIRYRRLSSLRNSLTNSLLRIYERHVINTRGSLMFSFQIGELYQIGHQSHYVEKESKPAIVLDDSCNNQCDFATTLIGKVKELSSLTNLKLVLANEGFDCIKLKYLGGFWVMIEFQSVLAKEKLKDNVAVGYWFSQLQQASNDFLIDERIAWVDIEGVPLKVWSKSTFNRIASKWGDILHIDQEDENDKDSDTDSDLGDDDLHDVNEGIHKDSIVEEDSEFEEVAETVFEKESSPIHMKGDNNDDQIEARSEDPFNIYKLLNKNKDNNVEGSNSNVSFKYPPSFTPSTASKNQPNACDASVVANEDHLQNIIEQEGLAQRAKKDWVKELCINNKVNFLSLQETKMEAIELLNVKACWGNFAFDYRYSALVGEWVPSGKKLLIISVYAPQELNEKKMLWDYLILVIKNWNGEVIIMGDFNEVWKQNERFGSKFNVHGADAVNSFISNAGLEEDRVLTFQQLL